MINSEDYPSIVIGCISVTARPTAVIGVCLRDAIRLAAELWVNVELEHNGTIWHVRPMDLVAATEQKKGQENARSP
jgi:hypothetical protein